MIYKNEMSVVSALVTEKPIEVYESLFNMLPMYVFAGGADRCADIYLFWGRWGVMWYSCRNI